MLLVGFLVVVWLFFVLQFLSLISGRAKKMLKLMQAAEKRALWYLERDRQVVDDA